MARINNLTNFITDVANAIKTKSEISRTITPSEFDTLINDIYTGPDTSDATAVADDIALDKTAYVNGEKITGTLSIGTGISANPNSATITANYVKLTSLMSEKIIILKDSEVELGIKKEYLARDIGLTANKIKSGETILGIEGTVQEGVDISDSTVTAGDVAYGKVFYTADGTRTVGTYIPEDLEQTITDLENQVAVLQAALDGKAATDQMTQADYNRAVDQVENLLGQESE